MILSGQAGSQSLFLPVALYTNYLLIALHLDTSISTCAHRYFSEIQVNMLEVKYYTCFVGPFVSVLN